MSKFLAIERAISVGPHLARFIPHLEAIASFPRINNLVERYGDGSATQLLDELEHYCGRYQIEPSGEPARGTVPSIFFANHPLGGADAVAAIRLLQAGGEPFKLLASRVVEPPPSLKDHIVRVDPTGKDRILNMRSLTKISRGFGRDYLRLFVFPAGLCSRLYPVRLIVSDPAWTEAFCRIAVRANANLVPVWFSGRNSALFYLLCLLLGRMGTVALPSEFFRPKRMPMVCRVGIPIPVKSTTFFGNQRLSALRAAVYSLEGGVAAGRAPRPRSDRAERPAPDVSDVRALTADAVDRQEVLALRRECLGDDEWSEADAVATHLVAFGASGCVGYCRVLDWRELDPALLRRISPIHSAFVPDAGVLQDRRIVEFGHPCVAPGFDEAALTQSLWGGLRSKVLASNDRTLAIGLVSLAEHSPVLASAQFEFVRRISPCARTQRFLAREPLVSASAHHDFRPEEIEFDQAPQVAGLPSIVRTYLAVGARFGPSAVWRDFGRRPSVLISFSAGELRLG